MPFPSEFNERDFEKKVDMALGRYTNSPPFSPDQIAEALLGFDTSWYIPVVVLNNLDLHVRRSRQQRRTLGVRIDGTILDELPSPHLLPPMRFKFNLFIQYKATEEVRGVNAREWSEWGPPLFPLRDNTPSTICLRDD
jgi:hypothetical protein